MKIPEDVPWRSTGNTLGSGGQGEAQTVTRQDEPEGPKYALKILRNAESLQARQRFRREIEVIKTLNSSAIVQIIDHSNECDAFQFYVMEYHEGARTLDSIIFSEGNLYHGDVKKSLDLFQQIISAIGDCQVPDPPVVHRDINPTNILVLPDETIRLIDFGICQVQDGAMFTLADENVGARNYALPECEAGNDESIDVRSDIYSASKVLWSAITSKRAFAREEAVFKDRSMEQLFPTKSDTWHLSHVFEETIRQNPSHRVQDTGGTLALISEVRYLVERGLPPLREVPARCPSCGLKGLTLYKDGYRAFGNPNARGVVPIICNSCGFVFLRNNEVWETNVQRLEGLS